MNKKIILILMFDFFFCLSRAQAADQQFFVKDSLRYENVKVVQLIKSDVAILEDGKKIRLIGIKGFGAPRRKMNQPTDEYGFVVEERINPTSTLEDKAYQFAQDLLEQKKIRVENDIKTTDADGYLLGYVFLQDGTFANAEILKQGYAELHIQPPNLKYADQLREAYREARFQKRGIHAE